MKSFFRGNTLCIARKKWRTAGGKDPLFGRVDGFQIGPNKNSNETGRFSPVSLAAPLTHVPGAADKLPLL